MSAWSTVVWVRDVLHIADDEATTLTVVARAIEDRAELSIRYQLGQDGALREEEHHLATRELHFGVVAMG